MPLVVSADIDTPHLDGTMYVGLRTALNLGICDSKTVFSGAERGRDRPHVVGTMYGGARGRLRFLAVEYTRRVDSSFFPEETQTPHGVGG
jgi:hypothetical protein